jgi:tight adherence protein B
MRGTILAATACTAIALALVIPAGARVGGGAGDAAGRRRRWQVGGAGALVVLLLVGPGPWLAAATVAATLVLGLARLVAGRRRERAAVATRSRVIELCDALQAELAAGQPPERALDRAAVEWPVVAPVARVAAGGGDVPAELRDLAAEPGAGALRVIAAAWQVAHRTGHGLADTLGRVAGDLRAAEQTRRIVAGELSSARATARLLAGLPFLALAMGAGAGAAPWQFLLGHPVGLGCLAGGLALAYTGLAWIDSLARAVEGDL